MCLTINVLFLITCKLFKDCTALILINIVTVAMSSRAACALRRARDYERRLPNEFMVDRNEKLYCIHCKTIVSSKKTFNVETHRVTKKHVGFVERLASASTSTSTAPTVSRVQSEALALTEAFLAADIPLHKLRNPVLKRYL